MNIQGNYSVSNMSYLINQVGYFDDFIAYCDTQNQYHILVGDYNKSTSSFKGKDIKLTRSGTTQQNYNVSKTDFDTVVSFPSNDYYIYSNVGVGQYYARDYSQPILITLIILVGFYIAKSVFGGLIEWKKRR